VFLVFKRGYEARGMWSNAIEGGLGSLKRLELKPIGCSPVGTPRSSFEARELAEQKLVLTEQQEETGDDVII